jgi:DNA-binding NarL/FixJ family response regulator
MGKVHDNQADTVREGESTGDLIRVLLCDDHRMFREGIVSRLSYLPDVEVVGEAANGAEAVTLARKLIPDVVVMDLEMPGMGGLEAIARILTRNKEIRVLVLTGFDSDADVMGALEKGAAGYVVKDSPSAELFTAIRRVASGLPHVSPDVASRLVRLRQAGPSLALNDREAEILRLVAEGKKTQEIARSVRLAERTVKHYLESIRQKLGAKNSSHAVALAIQRGLIRVDETSLTRVARKRP